MQANEIKCQVHPPSNSLGFLTWVSLSISDKCSDTAKKKKEKSNSDDKCHLNVLSCSLVDVYKTSKCLQTFQRNPTLVLEAAGSSVI